MARTDPTCQRGARLRVLARNGSMTTRLAWAFLCGALLAGGGCSLWKGELDPTFESRIDERLRRIATTHLEVHSVSRPLTVDEGLSAMKISRATTQPASPPETLELHIDDVRRFVLENNLDLRVSTLEPEIARTRISEEEAKFDATIMVGATYRKENPPAKDGDTYQLDEKSTTLGKALKAFESGLAEGAKSIDGKASQESKSDSSNGVDGAFVSIDEIEQQKEEIGLDAGIVVPLPTGARLQVGQSFDKANKLSPFSSDQSTSMTGFSLSQPLLRNAGIDANLASIRIARIGAKAAAADTRLIAIRLLAAAEKSYWMLYGARMQTELRRRLNDLAARNLEIVQKRAEEGLVASIELTRAQVGVAQQLEALIVAETNERIKQRELKRILNLENVALNSPTQLITATQPRLLNYQLDSEALVQSAVKNRMEMLELELAIAADSIRVNLAKNQALPLISLDVQYGIIDRGGSFGSAWQDAWDFDNNEFVVGIKGEIPVTNQLREAQLRRAVLNRTQRLASRAARDLAIRQEVYDALDLLNQNWQRILAARQTALIAGVNYEAELRQFDEGYRTMREVFEALGQLGDAQLREVNAIVAYQMSLVDLAFATGTLLGYSKVDFAETGPN